MAGHAIGRVGRALAVAAVDDVAGVAAAAARGRAASAWWAGTAATGLGYQNRDIAVHLPVARWLAPRHPRLRPAAAAAHVGRVPGPVDPHRLAADAAAPGSTGWTGSCSWRSRTCRASPSVARQMGISVACVPNWEWLTTDLDWLPYVDLMICPTAATDAHAPPVAAGPRVRVGRGPRPVADRPRPLPVPAPRAVPPVPVRQRHGRHAGRRPGRVAHPVPPQGGGTHRRDGPPAAATCRSSCTRRSPTCRRCRPTSKSGGRRRDNADLYRDGDVCVQPSHWEGLGLQLLECQAAGLPLVTTDAPPMNECRPFRAVPAADTEIVFVYGDQPVESQLVRPDDLAAVLAAVYDTDLRDASDQARAYIERERSWPRVREALAALLPGLRRVGRAMAPTAAAQPRRVPLPGPGRAGRRRASRRRAGWCGRPCRSRTSGCAGPRATPAPPAARRTRPRRPRGTRSSRRSSTGRRRPWRRTRTPGREAVAQAAEVRGERPPGWHWPAPGRTPRPRAARRRFDSLADLIPAPAAAARPADREVGRRRHHRPAARSRPWTGACDSLTRAGLGRPAPVHGRRRPRPGPVRPPARHAAQPGRRAPGPTTTCPYSN